MDPETPWSNQCYRVSVRGRGVSVLGTTRRDGSILAEGIGLVPRGDLGQLKDGLVDEGWLVCSDDGTYQILPPSSLKLESFPRVFSAIREEP